MSKDIKDLRLPLQKIIELSRVDGWFRGISNVAPNHLENKPKSESLLPYDPNTHFMNYSAGIDEIEIRGMVGFRRLLHACFANNVRVDVESVDEKSLKIHFEPTEPFSKSIIFDSSYENVHPLTLAKPQL